MKALFNRVRWWFLIKLAGKSQVILNATIIDGTIHPNEHELFISNTYVEHADNAVTIEEMVKE